MKALISPNEQAFAVTAWENKKSQDGKGMVWTSTKEAIGLRVAEISNQEFEVAAPLFWKEYNGSKQTHELYYDQASDSILDIINSPFPPEMETEKPLVNENTTS